MSLSSFVARTGWMGYWRAMRRYHRFEVRGIEHILSLGPAIIAGYHGRPGARDLVMLQALLLYDHGIQTRAIVHDVMLKVPVLRGALDGFEFVSRAPAAIAAAVAQGHKLVVSPGGLEEGFGGYRDRYRVKWRRFGYLRLALRHRLPIVPVAATGTDDAFIGLYDAFKLYTRLGMPPELGFWAGLGPTGLWPLTPPFPVRIVQYVAPPVHLHHEGYGPDTDDATLAALNARLSSTVQGLLDRGRAETRGRRFEDDQEVTWVDQT
jgi:1-acyl-sn-glycerol-3-phosphate acyltransferase